MPNGNGKPTDKGDAADDSSASREIADLSEKLAATKVDSNADELQRAFELWSTCTMPEAIHRVIRDQSGRRDRYKAKGAQVPANSKDEIWHYANKVIEAIVPSNSKL